MNSEWLLTFKKKSYLALSDNMSSTLLTFRMWLSHCATLDSFIRWNPQGTCHFGWQQGFTNGKGGEHAMLNFCVWITLTCVIVLTNLLIGTGLEWRKWLRTIHSGALWQQLLTRTLSTSHCYSLLEQEPLTYCLIEN